MRLNRALFLMLPLLGLGLALSSGCKKEDPKPSKQAKKEADQGSGGAAAAGGGVLEAKAFTATVKGRVTYDGPPKIEIKDVDKPNQDKGCPAQVMRSGWYTDKSKDKKGLRYAAVFLRPAGGMKMPKLTDEQLKPPAGKEILVMEQPKCQFEPRVLVLGPRQDIKFLNNSQPGMSHDANMSGPGSFSKTMPPGSEVVYKDIDASDTTPYSVSCNQHSAFMSAFVWKFKHPYAVVTDDDGNFEIKNVPIPTNGKFELMVWHEMLPGMQKIKDIEPKDGETITADISLK